MGYAEAGVTPEEYLVMREAFAPRRLTGVIICESPPKSDKYFFNPNGKLNEFLFRAVMRDILGFQPDTKEKGLREFQRRGLRLIDATYCPVNGIPDGLKRDDCVMSDFWALEADLLDVGVKADTPILLVKANICQLLDGPLSADGFNVINQGAQVNFPSTGNQTVFQSQVRQILRDWPNFAG